MVDNLAENGVSAVQGLLKYWRAVRTFGIVRYIVGVRCWGVSVKRGSTVIPHQWSNSLETLRQPLRVKVYEKKKQHACTDKITTAFAYRIDECSSWILTSVARGYWQHWHHVHNRAYHQNVRWTCKWTRPHEVLETISEYLPQPRSFNLWLEPNWWCRSDSVV